MTIDQPTAMMIAAGITVCGQVAVALINRKNSNTANAEEPEGKPVQKRRTLPIIALAVSIAAPLTGLFVFSRSQSAVTPQFVVMVVVLGALLVISLLLGVSVFIVRRYVEQSAERQRELMVLLQDRQHRHDKDMQRRAENYKRSGIPGMREIGGG